jgi:hypothetical protein
MWKALMAGMLVVGVAGNAAAQGPLANERSASLPKGTKVSATLTDSISSRSNRIGDLVSATIAHEVRDGNGNVIFPAGSSAELRIIDIKPGDGDDKDGALALQVSQVRANGQTYTVNASVDSVSNSSRKPGWTSDKKKIGLGAAAGAVVGGLVSGNLKGAVAGGILGAAGGAVVAHEMNGRDVIVKPGTTIDFEITETLPVMIS